VSLPETLPPVVDAPLFFLDYDGTLSELRDDPMKAFPHPEVMDLLPKLMADAPLWIITGRHLRDLGQLLPLQVPAVGLHGVQEGVLGKTFEAAMPRAAHLAIQKMKAAAPVMEDVWIEDKEHAFAVHYRGARDIPSVEKRLDEWLSDTPNELVIIRGKHVVELRPESISKGHAVVRLAEAHRDRRPIYIGDDTTDEEAFQALGEEAVTVKVGQGDTAARYRLPDVASVVAYLRKYL